MSTGNQERRLVGELSANQLRKLALNRHKTNWSSTPNIELFGSLLIEVGELLRAAVGSGDAWEEAADVANFAAMIADNTTRRTGMVRDG